jgi:hypothetical protein
MFLVVSTTMASPGTKGRAENENSGDTLCPEEPLPLDHKQSRERSALPYTWTPERRAGRVNVGPFLSHQS